MCCIFKGRWLWTSHDPGLCVGECRVEIVPPSPSPLTSTTWNTAGHTTRPDTQCSGVLLSTVISLDTSTALRRTNDFNTRERMTTLCCLVTCRDLKITWCFSKGLFKLMLLYYCRWHSLSFPTHFVSNLKGWLTCERKQCMCERTHFHPTGGQRKELSCHTI